MDSKFNLKDILEKHSKWLSGDTNGVRADLTRADLSGAYLTKADLSWANLSWAYLTKADLSWADLSGAYITGANLYRADLTRANLTWANLYRANLTRANLTMADLTRAYLTGANLTRANLSGADLSGANLTRADLSGANLSGANLSGADLSGADISGAKIEESIKIKFYPLVCPEYGSFIGWKKAYVLNGHCVIVKLQIPDGAKRSSAYKRKCRCNKAEVLELQNLDGSRSDFDYAISCYTSSFKYIPGEIVSVDDFDEDRWNECSTGIHFFITRQEAVDYVI